MIGFESLNPTAGWETTGAPPASFMFFLRLPPLVYINKTPPLSFLNISRLPPPLREKERLRYVKKECLPSLL